MLSMEAASFFAATALVAAAVLGASDLLLARLVAAIRLMTDFATSAADWRSFASGLRAGGVRRGDFAGCTAFELPADFVPPSGFEAVVALANFARSAFATSTCRIAARAASTFLRACFAAFFAGFHTLRAFFSAAFAERTCCLAASARATAFSASTLKRRRANLSLVRTAAVEARAEEVVATM
jgi:hypothetical protein